MALNSDIFCIYYLGNHLLQYDIRVCVNMTPQAAGDIRDIVLFGQGDLIRSIWKQKLIIKWTLQ